MKYLIIITLENVYVEVYLQLKGKLMLKTEAVGELSKYYCKITTK